MPASAVTVNVCVTAIVGKVIAASLAWLFFDGAGEDRFRKLSCRKRAAASAEGIMKAQIVKQ